MYTNCNILIFFFIIFYNVAPNTSVEHISQSPSLDQDFIEKYTNKKLLDCYQLKQKTKETICEYIFTNLELYSKYGYRIYNNRNAAHAYNALCNHEKLSFKYWESIKPNQELSQQETSENETIYNENTEIRSYLFYCYGRHDPMRTGIDEDDAHYYFQVSRGAVDTEFYIFRREMQFDEERDYFVLIQGIKDLDINALEVPDLSNKDLLELELQTLTQLSCNPSIEEIEINFLREIDNTDTRALCDLPPTKKLIICKLIVNYPETALRNTILSEENFSDESTKCVSKTLHFKFAADYSPSVTEVEMFPCYFEATQSKELKPWYVANGYRKSSALVFMEYNHKNLVQFYEFYENTGIAEIIESAND